VSGERKINKNIDEIRLDDKRGFVLKIWMENINFVQNLSKSINFIFSSDSWIWYLSSRISYFSG